jgi:hypothetical protein
MLVAGEVIVERLFRRHARLLELDDHQRQTVHEADQVWPVGVERSGDRHLAHEAERSRVSSSTAAEIASGGSEGFNRSSAARNRGSSTASPFVSRPSRIIGEVSDKIVGSRCEVKKGERDFRHGEYGEAS